MVRHTNLDDFIANYLHVIPYSWKLLPNNKEYTNDEFKRVKRNGANFELQVSDYMQWHVYANLPEPLWHKSWDKITNNSTILDIGANIGAFSIKTSKYLRQKKIKHKLLSIEPNPSIAALLQKNISINPELSSFIEIELTAISDTCGDMYLDVDKANTGGGKLTSKITGTKVKVETLDSMVFRRNLSNVSLIKIDVEGFEPNVLKGASKTIRKDRPVLIVEITDEWFKTNNSSASDVIDYLVDMDYRIYAELNARLIELNPNHKMQFPHQFNILAINERI